MNSIAEAVPQLVRIFSLGNSMGGRALLAAEVTNTNTGSPNSKPAIWMDGNIHGSQFAGSAICLAILQRLAAEHGRSPSITELLDNNTLYIVPRLAPDGAELCLTSGLMTSAGRRLGFLDGLREGLVPGDIDGDGRIMQMRVKDPYGQWKASKRDDRLLIMREPGDEGETFYRLYREGLLDKDSDSPLRLRLVDSKRELQNDFTPSCGDPNTHYGGSGAVGPFSQIESRLISAFMHSLSNLSLAISFRTGSGTIQVSSSVSERDKALLHILADKAAQVSGLPVQEQDEPIDFADWVYEELGVPCLRIDPWNLMREAGVESKGVPGDESSMLAVLRWLDFNNNGLGISKWTACEHPQLGEVEVGGWDPSRGWINPPPGDILAGICDVQISTALCLATVVPKISLGECTDTVVGWAEPAEDTGEEELLPLRIISVEIRNDGYLPVWLTDKLHSLDEPLISEISIPDDAELLMGQALSEHVSLSGIVSLHLRPDVQAPFFSGRSETQRCVERWLVRGHGEIVVSARHPRGGVVQFITDGGSGLRQRFKVIKPSAIIPDSPVPYVSAAASAALAAAIPGQLATIASAAVAGSLGNPLGIGIPQPQVPAAPKTPNLPRSSFKVPSASKPAQSPGRQSLEPQPVPAEVQAEPEQHVRPISLTESSSSARSAVVHQAEPEPASAPRSSVRGGYKPTAMGAKRQQTAEPAQENARPASDFAKPTKVSSMGGLIKAGSQEAAPAPLIKSSASQPSAEAPASRRTHVQPSGRVFGQPPAKPGTASQQPARSAEPPKRPSSPSRGDEPAQPPHHREVKPHPLLPRKRPAPQPAEPEEQFEDDGFEPPSVPAAPAAPRLLRRSRTEENNNGR